MRAILKLRLLSLIILCAYLDRVGQWLQIHEVLYDGAGVPMYVIVRWSFYRAVFPWVIQHALPPNLAVLDIEEIGDGGERYKYFCVNVCLRDYTRIS